MSLSAQERLVARLHDEGLAPKAIAKVSGLSDGQVFHALTSLGVSKKSMKRPSDLTPWEEAILLGCLLGDGHLSWKRRPHGTPSLKLLHSAKQADYAQWKTEQLGDLFFPGAVRPHDNNGNPAVHAGSRRTELLVPYHDLFYGDTTKRFSDSVLKRVANHEFCDVILAVWFGDDGYRSSGNGKSLGFVLGVDCVQMFERVAEWFQELGYEGVLHQHMKRETCRYLLFRVESAHRFRDAVAPYLPASMQYKLDIGPPRKIRRSRDS